MCYFEDCEDRYWPREDNTPDCPYEDCDNSTDTGNTNPGGTGSTNPGNSGNTGTSGGQSQSGNCPCDCDNSTDTGNTKPGGSGNTGTSGGQNQGGNCPCNCDNRTDTGNTKPGGSHICICNCDDCADGTCGTTRYYKPGESFCLYNASHSDYYAWSTEPSIIFVGTDGKAVAIREGSAYICIRSRSNPAFRHCIRVVATNTPPTGGNTQPGGNGSAVTGIEISGDSYGYVSDRLTMSCTVSPATATNKTVYWTSCNSSVASINSRGVLRCLNPGKTCVTATTADGGFTDSLYVTVYAKCERVTIETGADTMTVGTTQRIWAMACPLNTRQKIGYVSSDSSIASVSANGIVTAHAPGTARIVAYHDDNAAIYDTLDVVVTPSVTGISISGPSYGLTGGTVSMSYQARPSGAVIKNVQWRSQYPSIASVDTNGTVTCHKIGQTCIYVTTQDGRYTNQKTLTVYDPCTEVTTNLQRTAMIAGTTQTLNAAALPRTAMQRLSYFSSNSDVVSVSQYGILTAQALGSADITVTSVTNPDIRTSVTVTVYENPLSNIPANIENGKFRLENAHLKEWVCAASEFMSLHLAADTTNYQDTFDFKEIDGYYTISLTTSSGTFYIGEQFMPISSIPTHMVIMDEIVCPQCEFPYHFQWEIFKTDSGYSIRNAESQYFLCGTGGELRTANLDAILDSPAVYPCTWNIADPASNELYMVHSINQKEDPGNTWIYNYGCAVCAGLNVSSYYNNNNKVEISNDFWADGALFYKMPYMRITKIFQNTSGLSLSDVKVKEMFYNKIREEIDNDCPPLIHFIAPGKIDSNGVFEKQHWVTGYKYINNAKDSDSIFVLDPAGQDREAEAPRHSLSTAYSVYNDPTMTIFELYLTDRKPEPNN